MADIWLLYSTFPDREEALSVARHLVERQLAACVEIHAPMLSVYRWEGKMHEEQEVALTAKTGKAKVDMAIAAIKSMHSYQLPCITASPVEKGFAPFLQWVADETR